MIALPAEDCEMEIVPQWYVADLWEGDAGWVSLAVNTFYNKKYVLWNVYLPNVVRCIPYTVIDIFEYNCNDLELGGVKVIQGQR